MHALIGWIYVQVWERTGLPPVQPEGRDELIILFWIPDDGQVNGAQEEYVHDVQATTVGAEIVK